jgi:hypothetical protein
MQGGYMNGAGNTIVNTEEILYAILIPSNASNQTKESTRFIFKNGSPLEINGHELFEKIKNEFCKENK